MAALPSASCPAGKRPVSALLAMGSADQELKVTSPGDSAVRQLDAAGLAWSRRNGCTAARSTSIHAITTISEYARCADGTSVRTVAYRGLTHQWPGTERISGEADVGPHERLAGLVMAFFAQHHL
jgi:poly(3-hydroxybutyrate) depolymerase